MLKELEKEQRGLYNVVYNGKNATLIQKDLEAVDEAILFERGRENPKTNKGYGVEHILKHTTDPNAQGYITDLELVNIGKELRAYLARHKEPFIDKTGARLYEWEKEGVRFRLVVGDIGKDPSTLEGAKALSLPKERIITFYSDRNLKEAMEFKNPILKVQEKFKFNPQKARDLLEWHKDSHPLTKDKNGLPKVFYHGSKTKGFQVFRDYESGWGTFLSTHQKEAKFYKDAQKGSLIKSFIKLKNPFLMDTIRIENGKDYKEFALFLGLHKDDYGKNIGFNHFMRFERFKEYYNEIVETLAKHNLTLTEINPKHNIIRFVDKEGNFYNENMDKLSKKTRDIFNKNYFPISPRSVDFYDALGNEWIRNQANLALIAMQSASAREYAFYEVDRVYIKNFLKSKGHDGIRFNDYQFSVFDSNQIKHIDNKGAYSDGYDVWDKPSKKEIKENELEHKYFNESSPNIYQSNAHLGSGLVGGSVSGVEQDENGNLTFDPAKFVLGFLGGAAGSKSIERLAKNPKARAVMERIYLKKDIIPKMQQGKKVDTQEVIKILENSPQKGDDKILIGAENLNAEVIAWAIDNNKKIPINTLDETKAKQLGFRIPQKTTRSITPSEVIHTLKRHGENSPMVKNGNQKAVTLDEIAKYQSYADKADRKTLTKDNKGKEILLSGKQINGYYVVVEEIRQKVNELSFKTMYFEKGDLSKSNAFKNANH